MDVAAGAMHVFPGSRQPNPLLQCSAPAWCFLKTSPIGPVFAGNDTVRDWLPVPRVERVAQAVADEIERQHQQKNGHSGPYRHPRCIVDVVLGSVEHASPGGRRWLLP